MSERGLTKEQIGVLGNKIYQDRIKCLVEPREKGKFIAIDVQNGDFELADDLLTASRLLRERRPQSQRFGAKVGYPSAYRVGWKGRQVDG